MLERIIHKDSCSCSCFATTEIKEKLVLIHVLLYLITKNIESPQYYSPIWSPTLTFSFGEIRWELVRFGKILWDTVRFLKIQWDMRFGVIPWDIVRFDKIQWDLGPMVRFCEIWYIWWDSVRFDEIWRDSVRYDEIWQDLMRFCEILWDAMRFGPGYGEIW